LRARLISAQQAHAWLTAAYQTIKPYLMAEQVFDISIRPETRSTAQNRLLFSCLDDISKQVVWHGKKLDKMDWKNIFSATMHKLEVVPNLDGTGFVALGQSTSKMTRKEMSEMVDLIHAFGSERNVRWSETSIGMQG
jgi:hypothetical protein